MKRHPSLIKLSKDHHDGLILAQMIKKNTPAYKGMPADTNGKREYVLTFWDKELNLHFQQEEKILLPVVQGKDDKLDKLCNQMIDEHRVIESLVEKLKSGIENENTLNELGAALDKHIRMEERELFERIQEVLDEKTLNELGNKLTDQ